MKTKNIQIIEDELQECMRKLEKELSSNNRIGEFPFDHTQQTMTHTINSIQNAIWHIRLVKNDYATDERLQERLIK